MRVPEVMVVRPVAGGVAHVSAKVVAELRRQGRSVLDVPLAEAAAPAWPGLLAGLRAARRIRRAGIVHVEFGRTTAAPFWFAAVAVSLRRDVVVVAHDAPVLVHAPGAALMAARPGWRDAVAHRLFARLLDRPVTAYVRRRAGALAVLSPEAARRCAEYGPRVGVLRHGADPPVPGPPPSHSRTVVFAGFLSPAKGVEDLLDAWHLVGPESGFRLVIAGTSDRQHATWVTGLREESGAWANPPDWRDRLDDHTFHALIAGAAIVVLPYRSSNPISGILVRAMVQGRAVLATRVPATRSLIASGVDGHLVDAGELAAELAALMRDPQRRDRLGAAAALVAADRHTWARQVADLDAIYTEAGAST